MPSKRHVARGQGLAVVVVCMAALAAAAHAADESSLLEPQQITFGPKHHFFGYIGQCRTTPWNASGRYLLALRTDFQDRMPRPDEAADVVLLDAHDDFRPIAIDKTRGWNFQQGTMFYWNPAAAETQFFFNDRDPVTNKIFAVLYDISGGPPGRRAKEYRFDDTPVGNSGVAQNGGRFAAINYGRLARLRTVTGYPGAYDWTGGELHPDDDGVFLVDAASGRKTLLVSFRQLRDALASTHPDVADKALFINHTLWNRDDDLIYFYVRGDFDTARRFNVPVTIRPDGTGLRPLAVFIGGHPDWATGHQIIGSADGRQVIYDVDARRIVRTLGDASIFAKPEGDIALSHDARWLVNGAEQKGRSAYVFLEMNDGRVLRSSALDQSGYTSGDLRVDPSPCWNRDATQIVFPSLANDARRTRQMFLLTLPDAARR